MSNIITWIFLYVPLILFAAILSFYAFVYLITNIIYPGLSRIKFELFFAAKNSRRFVILFVLGIISLLIIIGIYLFIYFLFLKKLENIFINIPVLNIIFKVFSAFIYLLIFAIFITVIISPKQKLLQRIFILIKDFCIVFFIIGTIAIIAKLNNKITINI